MAGLAHDVLIQALRDEPALLAALLEKLTGRDLPGPLKSVDSAVRFTRSAEVRPDIVYRAGRSWLICEVQNKRDPTKARSWLIAMATLRFSHEQMGDLVVITSSPAVARWAVTAAHERGSAGSTSHLTPVVLLLDGRHARKLLDPKRPELALCAAWAMQKRHGAEAVRIFGRAFKLSERLPPPLRDAQRRAILNVLSDRLRSRLSEAAMRPERFPETKEARDFRLFLESCGEKRGLAAGRADGLAAGKRESLQLILGERGLPLTAAQRARIERCSDIAQLDTWLRRALTASAVADVLRTAVEPVAAKPPAPLRRPAPRRAARPAKNGTHAPPSPPSRA